MIRAALRAVNGVAIVNSVNGEAAVMESILPAVKKYGAVMWLDTAMDRVLVSLHVHRSVWKSGHAL